MVNKAIAVFGGSFNPPINSHITLAKQIINKFPKIEKLIFVPVSTKYEKTELVSNKHRYNMLQLVCKNEKKIEVSDIELIQKKQLYTIETLDLIKKQYGEGYDIYFVVGTDNLKDFQNWHNPDKILKKYKLLILNRNNDDLEKIILDNKLLNKNRNSLIKADGIDEINLSSTIIRDKIKKGENVEKYIPKQILKYIINNNLYK